MDKYCDLLDNNPLFCSQPFTNREAFLWIVSKAQAGGFSITITLLSSKWKWHSSKVKRFLNKLYAENLIRKEIKSGNLFLTIPNQVRVNNGLDENQSERDLQGDREPVQNQKRTENRQVLDLGADNSPAQRLINKQLEANSGLQTNQLQSQEEEKKKGNQKRKEEEFVKEKNIPYGDTKKEKMLSDSFQDFDLENSISHSADSFKANKVPVHLVETKDVSGWTETNLLIDLDLTWELGKFQDYWLTARKKPPKDGVAAFRNWLRKAAEIKTNNQGDRYDRFNASKQKTSDFQRFLIGGAGALDELRRDRLDRNSTWEE